MFFYNNHFFSSIPPTLTITYMAGINKTDIIDKTIFTLIKLANNIKTKATISKTTKIVYASTTIFINVEIFSLSDSILKDGLFSGAIFEIFNIGKITNIIINIVINKETIIVFFLSEFESLKIDIKFFYIYIIYKCFT